MSGPRSAISTADQQVRIRTARGHLTIGPHGKIGGLWRIVGRELRTNEQVRAMCASARTRRQDVGNKPVSRHALIDWRKTHGFPDPVLTLELRGTPVELWSRTEVEDWLADRAAAREEHLEARLTG